LIVLATEKVAFPSQKPNSKFNQLAKTFLLLAFTSKP